MRLRTAVAGLQRMADGILPQPGRIDLLTLAPLGTFDERPAGTYYRGRTCTLVYNTPLPDPAAVEGLRARLSEFGKVVDLGSTT